MNATPVGPPSGDDASWFFQIVKDYSAPLYILVGAVITGFLRTFGLGVRRATQQAENIALKKEVADLKTRVDTLELRFDTALSDFKEDMRAGFESLRNDIRAFLGKRE